MALDLGVIPKRRCKQKAELSPYHMQVLMLIWVVQTPGSASKPQPGGTSLMARGPPWHWKPETACAQGSGHSTPRPETCVHVWVHRHALAYTEMY